MATLIDYYNTGETSDNECRGTLVFGQTFTTSAVYDLTSVKLKLFREGSITNVRCEIHSTSSGLPTGSPLKDATVNCSTVTTNTAGEWVEFTPASALTVTSGTVYAIVLVYSSGDASNSIHWLDDSTSPTYSGGSRVAASDYSYGGGTYSANTGEDMMFEVWGDLAIETYTTTVSMDMLLRATDTETITIDTLIRDTDSKTVTVDTLVRDTDSITVTEDTLIKATDSTTVYLDTLIKAIEIQQITIDTLLRDTDSKTISIDTLIGNLHSTAVLTVDHTKFTTDRYNVPITIDQSWAAIKEFLLCDYKKLKIQDEHENHCWIEKVEWDAVNERIEVVFKAPFISSTVDTKFYLTGHPEDEDNPYMGATGSVAAQRVWANDDSTIANGTGTANDLPMTVLGAQVKTITVTSAGTFTVTLPTITNGGEVNSTTDFVTDVNGSAPVLTNGLYRAPLVSGVNTITTDDTGAFNVVIYGYVYASHMNDLTTSSIADSTSNNITSTKKGCLPADTYIKTANGFKKIVDIKVGDCVSTYTDGGVSVQKVRRVIDSGKKQLYELKTRNRKIRASGNHPFLVLKFIDRDGIGRHKQNRYKLVWTRLDELKRGDIIVTYSGGLVKEEEICASNNLLKLLGCFLGDGSNTIRKNRPHGGRIYYHLYDRDLINKYSDLLNKEGVPHTKNNKLITICQNEAYYRLSGLGFIGNAHNKVIPEWVFSLSMECKESLIEGFIDSDGYSTKFGYGIALCNKILIEQIRNICIDLGYRVGNVRTKKAKPGGMVDNRTITGGDSYILSFYPIHNKDNLSLKYGRSRKINYPLPQGFQYQTISSISEDGFEETYDLEIENSHNFIADGVIVHNSNEPIEVDGLVGKAQQTDGINDSISLGNPAILNITGTFSIQTLLKVNADVAGGIYDKNYSDGGFMLWVQSLAAGIQLFVNGSQQNSTGAINLDTWYTVSTSADGITNSPIYLDGVAKTAIAKNLPVGNTTTAYIGRDVFGRFCNITIGEFRLLNRAITADDDNIFTSNLKDKDLFTLTSVTRSIQTVLLDALLKATDFKTVSIDTLIKGLNITTDVYIDTLIKDTDLKTVLLDLLVKGQSSSTVSIDTQIRDTDSVNVSLDMYVKDTGLQTISISVLIGNRSDFIPTATNSSSQSHKATNSSTQTHKATNREY